jgi:ABC-2 type transport system ATP-binding protein
MRGRGAPAVFFVLLLLLVAAPAASARDAIVTSFDGTPIVTHFYPGKGASAGSKQPTIVLGHGWGGSGEPENGAPAPYIAAGYNVLTWDARGFGGSGGTVNIDHPEVEARDVQALVDFVAQQPEALMERAGDPRVGMAGPSYGGGIQFITAARDTRIDVIMPTIPWHNLLSALYPREVLRAGWNLVLVGAGIPTSVAQGFFSPAGIQTGHQSDRFYSAVAGGVSTGQLSDTDKAWFEEHGPDFLLPKVRVPVLIAQGTVDTLFDLDQAHNNYVALARNGTPLKMMWFCGGHGICNVGSDGGNAFLSGSSHVAKRQLQWVDRYLRGRASADPGPAFEWIDQRGSWHASDAYPPRTTGLLSGESAGAVVPLEPGSNPKSGILIQADPDPAAPIRVPIAAKGGEEVVGPPVVTFTYTALGATTTRNDGITHVFAQIVDRERNVVAGNQSTPIPIRLNGQEHRVTQELTRIAQKASGAGFELQIVSQSNLFDAQRATGAVQISGVSVKLPATEPVVRPCLRPSRIGFKLHRVAGTRVVRVDAYVNGKRKLVRRGRDLRRVELAGLPRRGSMKVRIVATHDTGSKVVSSRSWNGCAKGKPKVRRVPRPRR